VNTKGIKSSNRIILSFPQYQYQALKDLKGVSLLLLPPHGLTVAIALITTARPTNGIHFVNEKNACLFGPVVQAATSAAAHTSPSKYHVAVKAKKRSSTVVLLLFLFLILFFFFFLLLLLVLLLLLLQCVTTHYNLGQSYAIPIRRVKPWAPMGAMGWAAVAWPTGRALGPFVRPRPHSAGPAPSR